MIETSTLWIVFSLFVIILMGFDLGILQKTRGDEPLTLKESLYLSLFYMACGLLFSIFIGFSLGERAVKEYLTGFLLEKTLSLDNIFVISLIFQYLAIPLRYQYRVLFWGIMGVILLRGILIALGTALIYRFHTVLDVFAILLMITGIKMLKAREPLNFENNRWVVLIKRYLPMTPTLHGRRFWVKDPGSQRWLATPLLLALLVIETVDLIFALDSIPAIFSVTTTPYIVFTSNLFAILGLRALYFALSSQLERFQYLKYSLSLLLVFIGAKVLVARWLDLKGGFPASISLCVTLVLIAGGVGYSVYRSHQDKRRAPSTP